MDCVNLGCYCSLMEAATRQPASSHVARQVRLIRQRRGLSGAKVAERMGDAGVSWTRGTIAKLETGRRQTVSIDEVIALAYALDVPVVHLLPPTLKEDAAELALKFETTDDVMATLHGIELLAESARGLIRLRR